MISYAFIDAQNLHLSIKSLGWEIDYKKFFIYLQEKQKVRCVFLFIGYQREHKKLYEYLQKIGYILIFKPTILGKDGMQKGNCDGELILHAAAVEFNNYDAAIIISGDGDFYCLLEYLEKEKKIFKIGVPNENKYSFLLRRWSTQKNMFFISRLKNYIKKEP